MKFLVSLIMPIPSSSYVQFFFNIFMSCIILIRRITSKIHTMHVSNLLAKHIKIQPAISHHFWFVYVVGIFLHFALLNECVRQLIWVLRCCIKKAGRPSFSFPHKTHDLHLFTFLRWQYVCIGGNNHKIKFDG